MARSKLNHLNSLSLSLTISQYFIILRINDDFNALKSENDNN